jgi:phosphoglycolate phosphatase-like HAD superfamily hydrolase
MVRLILFDIDGTLIRTGGAGVQAFAKVFETEFNAVDGFEKLKFGGRTDYSLLREFFNFHQIEPSPENFKRFTDRYVFWLDQILHQTQGEVCVGVRELLAELKALPNAPALGLLTGNLRLAAEIKLRHFKLWDEFVTGAFADDHEDRNQIAAAAKERGSRLLGKELAGGEVVVVGDTPFDIRCARAIGARALAVATGGSSFEELRKHEPDWLVKDLAKIQAKSIV